MEMNRFLGSKAGGELITLQHLSDGEVGSQLYQSLHVHFHEPVIIVANDNKIPVQNFTCLRNVCCCILCDLFWCERRTCCVAPGRIANRSGHSADDEHNGV